jgi:NCS1 family nucleobase:cation symporter-1
LRIAEPPVEPAEDKPETSTMSPRTRHQLQHPAADRPWSVETAGIESVAEDDRHGTSSELFWVWLGANIGIVAIIYGATLTTLGLNLWQGAVAAVAGSVLSFVLVGVLGVAGKWGGAPMLGLSRVPFGRKGNLAPTLVSWISLLGWETVTAVIAAYAVLALLASTWHVPPTKAWMLVCLLGVATAALLLGRLGHATIVSVQRCVTWTFGLLTLAVLPWLVMRTHWSVVFAARPGSWLAVVGGVGIVAASTGISWTNLSADYSRYLPRRERGAAIVGWTTLGSVVPNTVLIIVGILLTSTVKGLATATDPIGAVGAVLPSWLAVPYLLAAVGGLLAQLVMGLYSSGLNLLALGVRVRRSRTVVIDGAVILLAGAFVMVVKADFFGFLVSFVQLLACGIATWAAVFVVDMVMRRGYDRAALESSGLIPTSHPARLAGDRGVRLPALISWLAGTTVGLLFTASPLFTGPLAVGVFAQSSLGYLLGFTVSASAYAVLGRDLLHQRVTDSIRAEAEPVAGRSWPQPHDLVESGHGAGDAGGV